MKWPQPVPLPTNELVRSQLLANESVKATPQAVTEMTVNIGTTQLDMVGSLKRAKVDISTSNATDYYAGSGDLIIHGAFSTDAHATTLVGASTLQHEQR